MTETPAEAPGPDGRPGAQSQPNPPPPPQGPPPPEAHGPYGPGPGGPPLPPAPDAGMPPGAYGVPPGGYDVPPQGYGPPPGYGAPPGYGPPPGYGYGAYGYGAYGYGPPVAMTSDDRTFGMLSHLLGLFTGFIGPLVVFLTKGKESPFIRDQSAEALNFTLTLLIAYLISLVLMFVIIGIFTLFAAAIGAIIFQIIACLAANRGEAYRYPINIRMVK